MMHKCKGGIVPCFKSFSSPGIVSYAEKAYAFLKSQAEQRCRPGKN
jgi:hypothetical protein